MAETGGSNLEKCLQRQVDDLQLQVEQLREQLAATGRRIRQDLSKISTLSPDTFDTGDPTLDAALADSAVEVFLRHMTAIRPDLHATSTQELERIPARETITQDEIDECVASIAATEGIRPPNPLAGLDDERMWILADLSCFGTGLTRHRATKELRAFLTKVWNDEVHVKTLETLVSSLHNSNAASGASALLHVLRLAASQSIERQGRTTVLGDT